MNGMPMPGMPMSGMHGTPMSGMTMTLLLFAGSYLGVWGLAGLAAIAAVVFAQKLFPPRRTLDLSLALAIIALGIATAAA